jgi:hypothetical protein
LVKQSTQQFYQKLGRTGESIYKKFLFGIQTSSVNRRSQVLHAEEGRNSTFIHIAVDEGVGPRVLNYTEVLCVLVTLATSDTGVTSPRPEHHRQAGRN